MRDNYVVITATADSIDVAVAKLAALVSYRLVLGWELQGGVSVYFAVDGESSHCGAAQAMTYGMTQKENLDQAYVG